MGDITPREWAMMAPIAAVVLWMGVYPESFLAPMRADIAALDAQIAASAPAGDADLVAGEPRAQSANAIEYDAHSAEGAH